MFEVAEIESALAQQRGPLKRAGRELRFRCFETARHTNGDAHPSARWNPDKQVWVCDVCKAGGGWVDLSKRLGLSMNGDAVHMSSKPSKKVTATYDYKSEDGTLLYQVVRYDPKDFKQRRPDGKGGWIWKCEGVRRVLYRLPELVTKPRDEPVFIAEGEKDVDNLRTHLGLRATCNSGGAGKFTEDLRGPLKGRHVVVIADKDPPGWAHAQQVAALLYGFAASVKVLELPGDSVKDASDWISAGGTREQLEALVKDAPEWTPVAQDSGAEDTTPAPLLPTLGIRTLASVEPETVRWLWPARIPRGKLTIIAGDPGLGKSFLALDIAARVSVGGVWPDGGRASQGDIILASGEDGVADTIRPRLDALGADVRRIHTLDLTVSDPNEGQVGLDLRHHLDLIARHVAERKATLLIVDPVLAFTGHVDTHRAAEVRAVLSPLAQMAEATGVAVVGIMHLNKRSGDSNALYRVSASLDFVAAARSAFLVARDPSNTKSALFVPIKANLAAPASALRFHFSEDGVLAWDGVAEDVDVAALLSPPAREDEGALGDAEDFLRELLADGPVAAASVLQEAKGAGIAEKTLRRAKEHLGVQAERETVGNKGQGRWRWFLPQDGHPQDGQTLSVEVGHLTKQIQTKAVVGAQMPQDGQHALTGHLTKQGADAAWGVDGASDRVEV